MSKQPASSKRGRWVQSIGVPKMGTATNEIRQLCWSRETRIFTFHNNIQNIYMEDYIRLLAKQQSLLGGTSLISMYIPPNGRVSLSKQKLIS